ncbi:MAG: SDR family oxidoreductase [Azospirillaceae bacterium]
MNLEKDLSGRIAVVTGSTTGIGFSIADALAGMGAEVVVNGRTEDKVEAARERLAADRPDATVRGVAADLATAEGCARLVAAEPRADVLVNNIGIFGLADFFEVPDADWFAYFETNVMSAVRLSRAYLPAMMERDWGRIVFLASEAALSIPPKMIHYAFTKTAALSLAQGLAKVAAGTGVTVNSVLPGPTLSDGLATMLAPMAEESGRPIKDVADAFVRENRSTSIIQRAAATEEVASMVAYVASSRSSATTGAALRVEGGAVDSIV